MREIAVRKIADGDSLEYEVRVRDGSGNETEHRVTVSREYLERFRAEERPEAFLEQSFRFLLEREPKESVLTRFDVSEISRYFPEYEEEIERRLL